MPIGIKFETPKLPASLADFENAVREEAIVAVNEALVQTRAEMVNASEVGATRLLRQSWTVDPAKAEGGRVSGRVFSSQPQALVLDEGARPHFPDSQPIEFWVRRKPGLAPFFIDSKGERKPVRLTKLSEVKKAAFAIRKSIATRGLKATGVFTKAFGRSKRFIDSALKRMEDRVVARFGR